VKTSLANKLWTERYHK